MAGSRFEELLDEMKDLSARKGADYAGSADSYANFRVCEKVGIPAHVGVLVRMGDKFSRIQELVGREWKTGEGPKVTDESIADTARDLAVYALHFIALREEAMRNTLAPPLKTEDLLRSYSPEKQSLSSDGDTVQPRVRRTR